MKKYLLSAIAVIAAGAFTSCNQNGFGLENINPYSREKVNFSSNITKVNLPTTRAGGVKWDTNDAIGIFMFEKSSTNIVEEKSNIEYFTLSEGITGAFEPKGNDTIFFPDNGDEVRFMSYYPYTADITDYVYGIDVSNQASQSAIDLLYSFAYTDSYNKTVPGKKVPLVFDHKLTKININVRPEEGLNSNDLKDLIVTFEGFYTKAEFDLLTGDISEHSEIKSITPLKIEEIADYDFSYESIVLPMTDPSTASLKFDLNNKGEQNSDVFTWNFKANGELKSGFEYTYNVTVNRSGIVVEAKINKWSNGGSENIIAE